MQLLFRDINGDVCGRLLQRFDEDAGLRAGAGAESDELDVRPEIRCNLGAISIENVDFGARNVIFRQLANSLEQRRTTIVVKIFARERARFGRKTSNYIRKKVRRFWRGNRLWRS